MTLKNHITLFYGLVLLGLADALYLSLTAFLQIPPTCGILAGCETVSASPYSRFFGIPIAYLGALFFLGLALSMSFLSSSALIRKLFVWYTGFGVIVALWSLYIMHLVIKAYCIYCLALDAVLILSFVVALMIRNRAEADERASMKMPV